MIASFSRRLAEEKKKIYEDSMAEKRAKAREEEAERARERERLAAKAKQVDNVINKNRNKEKEKCDGETLCRLWWSRGGRRRRMLKNRLDLPGVQLSQI